LGTNYPDSPLRVFPQMQAQFLIAVAENDDMREPNTKNVLKDAFAAAKVSAEIEVYPAAHGWCPPDSQVYDRAQAEKAWGRMLAMFKTALA
jgi:carboxymethylenebutenolidase